MIKINHKEFQTLIKYIKKYYGIDLIKKKNLIEGRLNNVIVTKGFDNFSDYLDYVDKDSSGKEATYLIDKLTTNHTYFMREEKHYDFMENSVLPYFQNTIKDRDLRIWSAGCSSGEEPYTTAILLKEFFNNNFINWDSKILATDISSTALNTALEGVYSETTLSKLPNVWKMKYFQKTGLNKYRISEEIRREVIFRKFNLMNKTFPFKKKFHLIFCRNVMIYFDRKTKNELIEKFYNHTIKGGYLFIGHSESVPRDETRYKYVMPSIYRKV
ncbi:MAG: protein-glutamate O-methyltransferase CheR [Eubacteriales bacterium]